MKTLRIILSILFLGAMTQLSAQEKYEIVEGAGHLVLKGKSNTSDWMLKSNELTGDAQLRMEGNQLAHLSRVIVNIDANTIENPDNKRMTRKANKVLLAGENPVVTFFAYGYSRVNDGPMQMKGNLFLAGKNLDLTFEFTANTQDDVIWIVATADTKFSDFGLEAPSDFGGAIQCEDDIKIEVQIPLMRLADTNN